MITLRGCATATSAFAQQAPQCRADGPLVKIPELPEASGLAASRHVPGRF